MSISISQTDNVGITVESDPLALKIASNLSDLASAPTARTNLGVPYSTDAQAIAGTSASAIIHPADYRVAGLTTNIWAPGYVNMVGATSGAGATTGATVTALSGAITGPNAGVAGYATRGFYLHYPSNGIATGYNFGTPSGHATKFYSLFFGSTLSGIKVRAVFGRPNPTIPAAATLAVRGYGWEWDWSTRTLNIIAHNGTTLTTTPVTWNPANARTYEMTATSDGAGTISLYVDGVLLGTSSGGPTTLVNTVSTIWWQTEIENDVTAGFQSTCHITNPKVFTTNG
jgi:hypothetical protein